jgi:hypothetical protein
MDAGWDAGAGSQALRAGMAHLKERMGIVGWKPPQFGRPGNPTFSAQESQGLVRLKLKHARSTIEMHQGMIRNRLMPRSGAGFGSTESVGSATKSHVTSAAKSAAAEIGYIAGVVEGYDLYTRAGVKRDIEETSPLVVSLVRWAKKDGIADEKATELLAAMNKLRGLIYLEPIQVEAWQPVANDEERLEDVLDHVSQKYLWIFKKQAGQVEDLRGLSEKSDPPSLSEQLLKGLGEAALSMAIGGIGGIVGVAVKSALKADMGENVASVLADMMKDSAKSLSKSAYNVAFSTHKASGDPRNMFFSAQRDALLALAEEQQQRFDLVGKFELRRAKDPLGQAEALFQTMNKKSEEAMQVQRTITFDQWCVYMAQRQLGVHDEGKDAAGNELASGADMGNKPISYGKINAKGQGTLDIRIDGTGSGKPRIVSAKIEGLNSHLRKELTNRAIKDIKVPLVVTGNVGVERTMRHGLQQKLWIGRNTAGSIWLGKDHQYKKGWAWLSERAGKTGDSLDTATEGAKLFLDEDIGDLQIPDGKIEG